MRNFVFKARNSEGVLLSGTLTAQRRGNVINTLKKKGYYLLSVQDESKISHFLNTNAGLTTRVGTKDKAVFTHQLATLLNAGMKITLALKTLARQTQNKNFSSVIKQIQEDIEQSSSLSEAMAKHPKIFNKVYTSIVAAAEKSGNLSESLSILSEQLKSQASVRMRIKSALVYPIFLSLVSIVIVAVLSTFVIPKFIELFVNAEQVLPLPTKILIGVTNGIKELWWMFVLVTLGFIPLSAAALKNRNFRHRLDTGWLKLPVIGGLICKLQLARFARTLGSLLSGGVRIASAVKITRTITSNRAFAGQITDIESKILKGSTLAEAIREQDNFGELAANMIAVGEDTGMLSEMLMELADINEQESESTINSLTALLGPLMIVVLGLIIGFVVLAILMPIFETSTMIS